MTTLAWRTIAVPIGDGLIAKMQVPVNLDDLWAAVERRLQEAARLADANDIDGLLAALGELQRIGRELDAETEQASSARERIRQQIAASHRKDERGVIVFEFSTVDERKPLWGRLRAIEETSGKLLATRSSNKSEIRKLEKRLAHVRAAQHAGSAAHV